MIFAYARTSTLEQAADDKASLGEQLKRCKAIAVARGVTLRWDYKEFVDKGISGSLPLSRRPQGRYLCEQAGHGDIIVASKLDRIFRSGADALATVARFKRSGIGLIICDIGIDPVADSPSANLFFGMLSLVAQFERERIHERITEGKAAKRERGGFIGGRIPFGYRKTGFGKTTMLLRDEKEQGHIRRAIELMKDCQRSYSNVARLLASEGIVGRDGKPYTVSALIRMLAPDHRFGVDLVKKLPVQEGIQ